MKQRWILGLTARTELCGLLDAFVSTGRFGDRSLRSMSCASHHAGCNRTHRDDEGDGRGPSDRRGGGVHVRRRCGDRDPNNAGFDRKCATRYWPIFQRTAWKMAKARFRGLAPRPCLSVPASSPSSQGHQRLPCFARATGIRIADSPRTSVCRPARAGLQIGIAGPGTGLGVALPQAWRSGSDLRGIIYPPGMSSPN
ncbi:hypothetical protein ACVIIV_003011 [Bradyrhizobium sp. USDA 4354]